MFHFLQRLRVSVYMDHFQGLFLMSDLERVVCVVPAAEMRKLWVVQFLWLYTCLTLLQSVQLTRLQQSKILHKCYVKCTIDHAIYHG
jgi:hypothetical protein